jgi:hypothetical protein
MENESMTTVPSEPICLTEDEAAALREVLAMLAVMEERGLDDRDTITISRQMWRDMLLRPAQRLRRVTQRAILAERQP